MVGTVEEALARKRNEPREDEPLDGLTDFDRDIAGRGGAHILLPYPIDTHNLKRVGGLLQGFGADLVNLSNQHELKHRSKVLEWRALVKALNRRLREMIGKGKRPHPWDSVDN